jgi:hypothetical protein
VSVHDRPAVPVGRGPFSRPSTPPQTNCIITPSRCGFPDSTNSGVAAGTPLTVISSGMTVSTAGAVVEDKDIRGCLTVTAANVTIRRSKVSCGGGNTIRSNSTGLLIEDVTVSCSNTSGTGIAGGNFTAPS